MKNISQNLCIITFILIKLAIACTHIETVIVSLKCSLAHVFDIFTHCSTTAKSWNLSAYKFLSFFINQRLQSFKISLFLYNLPFLWLTYNRFRITLPPFVFFIRIIFSFSLWWWNILINIFEIFALSISLQHWIFM